MAYYCLVHLRGRDLPELRFLPCEAEDFGPVLKTVLAPWPDVRRVDIFEGETTLRTLEAAELATFCEVRTP